MDAHLGQVAATVSSLTSRASEIEGWQAALRLPVTPCEEAKLLASIVKIATELWECIYHADAIEEAWADQPIASLEPALIDATIKRYSRAITQAERGLPKNTVVQRLRVKIDAIKNLQPLVDALRNPHLTAAHLDKLDAAVGTKLPRGDALTVALAIEADLPEANALAAKISTDATQEALLLETLDKVRLQRAEERTCACMGACMSMHVCMREHACVHA